MKNYVFLLFPLFTLGQQIELLPNPDIKIIEVEASCGICMFDMEGKECELAVKTNGKKYYVIGTGIDDHGDAPVSYTHLTLPTICSV